MNPRGAPERIRCGHLLDEPADRRLDGRASPFRP
jgi:hypothetical protein